MQGITRNFILQIHQVRELLGTSSSSQNFEYIVWLGGKLKFNLRSKYKGKYRDCLHRKIKIWEVVDTTFEFGLLTYDFDDLSSRANFLSREG